MTIPSKLGCQPKDDQSLIAGQVAMVARRTRWDTQRRRLLIAVQVPKVPASISPPCTFQELLSPPPHPPPPPPPHYIPCHQAWQATATGAAPQSRPSFPRDLPPLGLPGGIDPLQSRTGGRRGRAYRRRGSCTPPSPSPCHSAQAAHRCVHLA